MNAPENSQSVLLANISFTALASSVLELFATVPVPARPPIFIYVSVAGIAGSPLAQVTVELLFNRFQMGLLPDEFRAMFTIPSIATSGTLSEWTASAALSQTFIFTMALPRMLKFPKTVRRFGPAESEIYTESPIWVSPSSIVARPMPAASEPMLNLA